MNSLLENKLNTLKQSKEFECWYLVKHSTNFTNLCYLVSFLKDFIENPCVAKNLESYIDKKASEINSLKPDLKISNNYRALRVAAFFGLIKMTSSNYNDCCISKTYDEICHRCQGVFENTDLYQDIITRQIEKMFISSSIDEGKNNTRKDYAIFPIMFLDKILIEIGKVTNDYSISMNEYRYFVATTKKFSDYLDTMIYIKLLREECNEQYGDSTVLEEFRKMRDKFDNRMNKAIELLDYIDCSNDRITLKKDRIEEVTKKVYEFENNSYEMNDNDYIEFLCSTKSLFDLKNNTEQNLINTQDLLEEFKFKTSPITDGQNLIVYGTPGCGKSYYVEHTLLDGYPKDNYIRTTFYQDYTNTDFVGQILPVVEGDKVTYKFNPGPFTLALEQAIRKPNERIALVIEELNRGSAASIFGDIFQLLDRKEGVSEYGITNVNIINYLKEKFEGVYTFKEIRLPGNLSIYATMNTSDQNVFTLDTAFKRRWKFKKLINEFAVDHQFKNKYIPGADITWEELVNDINEYILECSSGLNSEDKQLGVYFVDENGMRKEKVDASDPEAVNAFAYKVLEYLWSDVAKFDRSKWFADGIKSLDELVKEYKEKGLEVFVDGIFNK